MTKTKAQEEFEIAFRRQAQERGHDQKTIDRFVILLEQFGPLALGVPSWKVKAIGRTIGLGLNRISKHHE